MSQIVKKFISDNAIDGAKIRHSNNESLRARNAAGTADVDVLKVTASDKIEFQALPEVAAALAVPSTSKQLATVEYVLNIVAAKGDAKDAVSALADADVPLTGAAPLTIDGVNLGAATTTPAKRVLLAGQSAGAENGFYDYTVSGATYTLTRSSDAATSANMTSGAYTFVIGGTVYSGYEAILTTADPITLDTTALTFAKHPSVTALSAGDMLAKTGNDLSVDLASLGGLESTNAGNAAGQLRVKIDQAAAEKDQSTRRDGTTGAVMARMAKKQSFTLAAGDITNGYVDLSAVAGQDSVKLAVAGAGEQYEGTDFTVNYTGGTSSKTRVTFAGGLASAGVSALAVADVIVVSYTSF